MLLYAFQFSSGDEVDRSSGVYFCWIRIWCVFMLCWGIFINVFASFSRLKLNYFLSLFGLFVARLSNLNKNNKICTLRDTPWNLMLFRFLMIRKNTFIVFNGFKYNSRKNKIQRPIRVEMLLLRDLIREESLRYRANFPEK